MSSSSSSSRISRRSWLLVSACIAVGCGRDKSSEASSSGAARAAGETSARAPNLRKPLKELVIGFAQTGAEGDWRIAHSESIKAEAQQRGIELLFADAQNVHNNQVNAVNGFITRGVDLIVIAPQESLGWRPTLKEAKRAGIPVVLTSRGVDAPEEYYETVIVADFVWEGRQAAEWLVRQTGGRAKVVEIVGTPAADVAVLRKKGFAEVLAKHPGMKLVGQQSGDFSRNKARSVMQALLEAHKGGIDAVFAHDDPMALGAIAAIEGAGLEPGRDIKVIGVGAVKAGFEAMLAGTLNATVECTPLHGPLVFDVIEKLARGERVPKRVDVPGQVFEMAQASAMIASRKY